MAFPHARPTSCRAKNVRAAHVLAGMDGEEFGGAEGCEAIATPAEHHAFRFGRGPVNELGKEA